jgi:hypothetical protein
MRGNVRLAVAILNPTRLIPRDRSAKPPAPFRMRRATLHWGSAGDARFAWKAARLRGHRRAERWALALSQVCLDTSNSSFLKNWLVVEVVHLCGGTDLDAWAVKNLLFSVDKSRTSMRTTRSPPRNCS